MEIQSAKWVRSDQTYILVNETMFVPWPCDTWHREVIEAWMNQGNEPDPADGDDT